MLKLASFITKDFVFSYLARPEVTSKHEVIDVFIACLSQV